MARNTIKKDAPQVEEAPLEGGTLGVPTDAETKISASGGNVVGSAKAFDHHEGPKAKRYTVVASPGTVMYDGHRVPLRIGKEVSDVTYDLQLLVNQGVQLQRIPDDAPTAGDFQAQIE